MIKISEVVKNIFEDDENARIAANDGFLSVTKYSKKIKPLVDEELLSDVNLKSIVVSLHRILKKQNLEKEINKIKLQNISINSDITDITVEKTQGNLKLISKFRQKLEDEHIFYTLTSSINEITILIARGYENELNDIFRNRITFIEKDLSGITVKFDKKFITQPKLFFELIKRVSLNDINIIEIASTATELTFFIYKEDTEKMVRVLSKYL